MKNFDNMEDEAKKENILRYAIKMSMIDGEVGIEEYSFLRQLSQSINYDEQRLRELFVEDDFPLNAPIAEVERMEIIIYVFYLIKADRKVSEKEEGMLFQFGLKLGFSSLFMDDLLGLLMKHIDSALKPGAILNEAKKYFN